MILIFMLGNNICHERMKQKMIMDKVQVKLREVKCTTEKCIIWLGYLIKRKDNIQKSKLIIRN